MALPEKGTFKIATVGPAKTFPKKDKPNESWTSYSLQFEGDPNWYDTFWSRRDEPAVSMELTGTKDEHEKFGLQFKMDWEGGNRKSFNPAQAQALVMGASVEAVNGFLSLGDNYALWEKNDPTIKEKLEKYIASVVSVSSKLKEAVINMGSLQKEEKVADKAVSDNGDPGPTPPPDMDNWPEDQEEQVM